MTTEQMILGALFVLICSSFGYTYKATSKIWDYLTNHLSEKVRALVREELQGDSSSDE